VSKSLLNSGLSYYKVKPSFPFIKLVIYPIVRSLLRYQKKQLSDSIGRNLHTESKNRSFWGLISSRGMYYVARNMLINLNFLYQIKRLSIQNLYS